MTLTVGILLVGMFLIVAAELAARMYVRHSPYRVLPPGRKDVMHFDMSVLPSMEPTTVHKVNRHGERGSERPHGDTAFRVLVAGGSSAGCYLLDQKTAWAGALERDLQELPHFCSRRVHVGNVGQSSIDSGSLLVTLERILPQEHGLDLLLLMVGASDVLRWLEIEAPPERAAEAIAIDECFARHPEMKFGLHPRTWALATLYRWRRDAKGKVRTKSGQRYAVARRLRAEALETRTLVPKADVVIKRFESNLRACIKLAQKHARNVVVVRQPWFRKAEYLPEELAQFWSGSVGDAYTQNVTAFYSPEVVSALMNQIDRSAADVAAQLGIPSVDVNASLAPSNSNYMDQFHFTPQGSRIVARCVRDQIAQKLGINRELL